MAGAGLHESHAHVHRTELWQLYIELHWHSYVCLASRGARGLRRRKSTPARWIALHASLQAARAYCYRHDVSVCLIRHVCRSVLSRARPALCAAAAARCRPVSSTACTCCPCWL